VQELKDKDPSKFKKEYFYSKWFTVEPFTNEFMEKLRTIMPEQGENLSNAPPNAFMPKPENIISMKNKR